MDLERHLAGVRMAFFVGHSANGSILCSAPGACARDGGRCRGGPPLGARAFSGLYLTRWQLLDQSGYRNVTNEALAPSAVTLARSDLATFGR